MLPLEHTVTDLSMPCDVSVQAGVGVAFGSDWPVIYPEALLAIYAAVHRKGPDTVKIIVPEETITAEQALRAHTADAATVAGLSHTIGSLM